MDWKDKIKNETIRGIIAKVTPIKSVLTKNRLSWYGHVMRREETVGVLEYEGDWNKTQRTSEDEMARPTEV